MNRNEMLINLDTLDAMIDAIDYLLDAIPPRDDAMIDAIRETRDCAKEISESR